MVVFLEITCDAKTILDALKIVELKGKHFTSTGLKSHVLGSYVKIIARRDYSPGWYFVNASPQTFVSVWIPGIPVEEENKVMEISKLEKYLKNFSGDVTLSITDKCVISAQNKRATLSVNEVHPSDDAVTSLWVSTSDIVYDDEIESDVAFGKTKFNTGVQIKSKVFDKIINSCEVVGHGIYKFEVLDNAFKISSISGNENYTESFPDLNIIGPDATVEFTGPIHKAFTSNEKINIYFNDDSLVVIVSPTVKLVRAPYVVV